MLVIPALAIEDEDMANDLIKTNYSDELARIQPEEIRPLFEKALSSVREEVVDNPYIVEAIRVLQVGGYRSAIGSFWNAVVDDLRNKIKKELNVLKLKNLYFSVIISMSYNKHNLFIISII